MTCSSSTIFTPKGRIGALLLLAAASVLAGPARADGGADARAAIGKAEQALGRGDGIAAEVPLREAMRAGVPADAVRAWLGMAMLAENDLRGAAEVLGTGGFAPGSEALGWRARGELAMAQGDLPIAGQAFDQSLRFVPDDSMLWVDIARLRFAGGEQAQAVDAAQRAARLDPRNPRALEIQARMVRERDGPVPALAAFEQGLRVAPADAGLLAEYAATLGDSGRYRQMLVAVRALMKVSPDDARGYYLQAVLAARAGQTELARRLMLKTGTSLRDSPGAILLNGVLEFGAGNINLAIEYFDRLVRIQPDNLAARALLARALARNGDWEELLDRFQSNAARGSTSPYLTALVARAFEEQGLRDRAAPLLERAANAIETTFAPIPVRLPLGVLAVRYADAPYEAGNAVPFIRALLAGGDPARALQVAMVLRNANPGSSDVQALVGDVRMAGGDPGGAAQEYRAALAIRRTPLLLERLVGALRASGREADADALAAQYLAASPASLAAMRLLATGDARNGNWTDAAQMLDALARRGQGGPLLLAQQANMAMRMGERSRALAFAMLAYRAQPGSLFTARALAEAQQ